jgi:hypothetical protein
MLSPHLRNGLYISMGLLCFSFCDGPAVCSGPVTGRRRSGVRAASFSCKLPGPPHKYFEDREALPLKKVLSVGDISD